MHCSSTDSAIKLGLIYGYGVQFMIVEHIFIRPAMGEPQVELQSANVIAGAGIEGDRYFGRHDEPGQNITLVESEEIESFLAENNKIYNPSVTGRNVITRGIRLNELVGQEFLIGAVRFRGVELCEPCLGLGTALQSGQLSADQVVRRLAHKSGLRADALTSGKIAPGEKVCRCEIAF